jgi:transcription elongation factor S-II
MALAGTTSAPALAQALAQAQASAPGAARARAPERTRTVEAILKELERAAGGSAGGSEGGSEGGSAGSSAECAERLSGSSAGGSAGWARRGLAEDIERSAYNMAVSRSRESGVPRAWGSRRFAAKYEQCAVYCVRNARAMASLIESGAVRARDVASCSSQALSPGVWSALVSEKKSRDSEANKGAKLKANTTTFRCGRCRSRECYFYELQTRSADEPMSVFITCLDCGHRWRKG